MKIKDDYNQKIDVKLLITNYFEGDNLAIILIDSNTDEIYSDLTTNLDYLMPGYAYVLNDKKYKTFIDEYKLGKCTGIARKSGFNEYLLYEFDLNVLKKYAVEYSNYICL